MLHESSYLDEAGIGRFFAGMKKLREREGLSLEEMAERTGMSYNDLNYLETGQYDYVSQEVTDPMMTNIASVLGYDHLEDVMNA